MQEPIFSIGDYVELFYNDKKYIGFIVGKKQGAQELMFDVLVERNNKSINTLSKNRVDTNRMVLLAKANTRASIALKLALDAHEGQVDKAGIDYTEHIVMVGKFAKLVTEKDGILAVAYLHDILEDTQVTEENLKELFSDEIVEAVKALTKEKYEPYQFYLERVKANKWARIVKLADLKHNSDMDRIKKKLKKPLGLRDFKRMKKYQDAIRYLEEE